jgi:hypothetical protein
MNSFKFAPLLYSTFAKKHTCKIITLLFPEKIWENKYETATAGKFPVGV